MSTQTAKPTAGRDRRRAQQVVQKLLAALDRTIAAAEETKQCRDELARIAARPAPKPVAPEQREVAR